MAIVLHSIGWILIAMACAMVVLQAYISITSDGPSRGSAASVVVAAVIALFFAPLFLHVNTLSDFAQQQAQLTDNFADGLIAFGQASAPFWMIALWTVVALVLVFGLVRFVKMAWRD